MVLKGRNLAGRGFDIRNIILRVTKYHVNSDGELSVELGRPAIVNWSTDDIVFVVTKNSRLARVGKIRPMDNGTDELRIGPLNQIPIDPEWEPVFLGALRNDPNEELYMAVIPAADVLVGPRLWIELSVKSDLLGYPQHQGGTPYDELPLLVAYDGTGNVDPRDLLDWLKKANELAQAPPGLKFGYVTKSLPKELAVGDVDYKPRDVGYEQAVFPKIDDVRVVSNGGAFMIYVEAGANRGARGKLMRRNPGIEAVEAVGVKKWQDFIREAVDTKQRMVLSVVHHDLGTVVVDNWEVESIKRVCKKGKKLHRIVLKQAEKWGGLNSRSRVNAGSYRRCSVWVNSWDDLPGVTG
jgi:hypothetical protein